MVDEHGGALTNEREDSQNTKIITASAPAHLTYWLDISDIPTCSPSGAPCATNAITAT